ncbi:MAG: GvpL/GvpF family gas vesicle protein, partial [Deltaproteobacteria bacterium]|nr:GvpL/GvpF family gas vesicle protein [Deltaproteobacteria bacterium]
GRIGIDGSEVYSVPFKDLCAVVHNCPAEPYRSENQEKMVSWAVTHQHVVEEAWKGSGTVIPVRFGTIVKDRFDGLNGWLNDNYEGLRKSMERFREKEEYGIQVFWNTDAVGERLIDSIPELQSLKMEMDAKHGGAAYMHKQLLDKKLRQEMESEAGLRFRELYCRIKERVEELNIEKTKETSRRADMLMNLSCLVHRERAMDLIEELDMINMMDNFSIRLTGPWPPYSFAGLP